MSFWGWRDRDGVVRVFGRCVRLGWCFALICAVFLSRWIFRRFGLGAAGGFWSVAWGVRGWRGLELAFVLTGRRKVF